MPSTIAASRQVARLLRGSTFDLPIRTPPSAIGREACGMSRRLNGRRHLASMLATLVMTVIGADRPGLVQMVAARVADHGGNWLESRMCRLGGQFAGILRIEVAKERRDE